MASPPKQAFGQSLMEPTNYAMSQVSWPAMSDVASAQRPRPLTDSL